jgi:xylose isomerase
MVSVWEEGRSTRQHGRWGKLNLEQSDALDGIDCEQLPQHVEEQTAQK